MKKLEDMSTTELIDIISVLRAKRTRSLVKYKRTTMELNGLELNKQMIAILRNMTKDKFLTVVEIDQLARDAGDLVTVQDVGRIAGFYKQRLLDAGYIKQEA